jgi:hypothetical protein
MWAMGTYLHCPKYVSYGGLTTLCPKHVSYGGLTTLCRTRELCSVGLQYTVSKTCEPCGVGPKYTVSRIWQLWGSCFGDHHLQDTPLGLARSERRCIVHREHAVETAFQKYADTQTTAETPGEWWTRIIRGIYSAYNAYSGKLRRR